MIKSIAILSWHSTKVKSEKGFQNLPLRAIVTFQNGSLLKKKAFGVVGLWLLVAAFGSLFGQNAVDLNEKRFLEKAALVHPDTSTAKNLVTVGRSFLGTRYVSGVLDRIYEKADGSETLVVDLGELDCVTFIENVAAIVLAKKNTQLPDYQAFKAVLQQLRYRDGRIDGYASRLHYFSEWIDQQAASSHLEPISEQLGGAHFHRKIQFMTARRHLYKGLKNDAQFDRMLKIEADLSARSGLFWIPKNLVRAVEKSLEDGDLIAIVSTKAGLDLAHEGFAVWENGRVHLLHASSEFKKVIVSEKPLTEYLAANAGQAGIMVARFF